MNTKQYLEQWLEDQILYVQRSTWESLTIYVKKHLIPYFGSFDLADITPFHCQSYVHHKLKSGRSDGSGGLSPVSVRKHISVLKQSLEDAVVLGLIPMNPARYVRFPRNRSTVAARTVFLTADEATSMLDAFEGHPLYAAVILSLYYGLTRSEVLGLKWSSVDFDRDLITIRHTVVKNLSIEAKDSTKTENRLRTFSLIPELKEILLDLCPFAIGEYVFSRSDGSPIRPDSLTRTFQRVLKRNGLPRMRFHDLRHSTASILFDRNWSLEDVKQWLGHADIETTSNIYLHYRRSRLILVGDDLRGMLIKKKKP